LARLILAAGGIVAFIAVCEAAHVVSVLAGRAGVIAGAAVICAVFTACWYVFRVRPMLHPVPLARHSGTREAQVTTETPTLAGTATAG
jgi:hypothetical protein